MLLDLDSEPEFLNIATMYNDYIQDMNVLERLMNTELVSFISSYREIYRKIFVIACANSFERHFCRKLPELVSLNPFLRNFIKNQALERKYHTLFRWDSNNANGFYGLFGDDFSKQMQGLLKENSQAKQGEKSFLLIGHYRNLTTHKGFDSSEFQEDIASIKNKFDEAIVFYEILLNKIKEFV